MIVKLRQDIATALQSALELPPRVCEVHRRSRFVPADMQLALRNRHFALRVAFMGVLEEPTGQMSGSDYPAQWCVFICAKDGDKAATPRDELILDAGLAVMEVIRAGGWSVEGATLGTVEKLRFTPGYQGDEDETHSMASWAVTWKQTLSVDAPGATADLRPLTWLITHYDLAPAEGVIDATDEIRLIEEP